MKSLPGVAPDCASSREHFFSYQAGFRKRSHRLNLRSGLRPFTPIQLAEYPLILSLNLVKFLEGRQEPLANSDLLPNTLIEIGNDHRFAH
jgi:hypothetical protein